MILWEHRNEHALVPGQAALSFSRDPVPAMLCSRPPHHLIGDLVPACTIAYAIHPLLPMLSSPTPDAIPLQFEMHLPSKSKSLLREIRDQASVDHKNQDFTLKDDTFFFFKKGPLLCTTLPFPIKKLQSSQHLSISDNYTTSKLQFCRGPFCLVFPFSTPQKCLQLSEL